MVGDEPFSWWEDKQVAVKIDAAVVRGWVLSCRRADGPAGAGHIGQMTIVLLIGDPATAAQFPKTIVLDVVEDGLHGRSRVVRGVWAESDLTDVRTAPSVTAEPPVVPRPGRASVRGTRGAALLSVCDFPAVTRRPVTSPDGTSSPEVHVHW